MHSQCGNAICLWLRASWLKAIRYHSPLEIGKIALDKVVNWGRDGYCSGSTCQRFALCHWWLCFSQDIMLLYMGWTRKMKTLHIVVIKRRIHCVRFWRAVDRELYLQSCNRFGKCWRENTHMPVILLCPCKTVWHSTRRATDRRRFPQ